MRLIPQGARVVLTSRAAVVDFEAMVRYVAEGRFYAATDVWPDEPAPADHPARPADYRPLDAFWRKRGYEKLDDVVAEYSWKDLGDTVETAKPLQFWMRKL